MADLAMPLFRVASHSVRCAVKQKREESGRLTHQKGGEYSHVIKPAFALAHALAQQRNAARSA